MLNILIAGCGNIGKRHLFSLNNSKHQINIQVLEKDIKKIKIEKFKNESKYKPGFYNMCNSFIKNNLQEFCTIDQQINNFKFVHRILGWKD